MIDQDYTELLNRSPPSGDVLEWTFSTRTLANLLAALLLGTPALCFALYYGMAREGDPREGAYLRVPTLTRLGMKSPTAEVLTAGLHLAAVVALALFWCVRLAHHQRLQARTGIARYDLEAEGATRWVTCAWFLGALGAVCLFVAASVTGDEHDSFSAKGDAHLVLFWAAGMGFFGQATCTAWAIRKARRVFVVSDADLVSYRRKLWLSVLMVVAIVTAIASVVLIERFVDNASLGGESSSVAGFIKFDGGSGVGNYGGGGGDMGEGEAGGRDCDAEWCYSRSALALWEWVLLLLEAGFCIALRHDLVPATGGVGVESFVL